jgi:SAM-dependent methyltransferase
VERSKEFSSDPIDKSVEAQHEWLMIGGREKARSVSSLTRGLSISSVLDIGSGTGAVLNYLDEMNFGEEYFALEPSASEMNFMLRHARPTKLKDAQSSLLEASDFATRHFDLAILSHVLEHVDAPASLLGRAIAIADYVVVEVPLEGNAGGNIRAALKETFTHRSRLNNPAGHIQFFSTKKLEELVHWCGGEILQRRLYVPPYHSYTHSRTKRVYHRTTDTVGKVLGDERWARLYHGHYAVLVKQRADVPAAHRTLWSKHYFYEEPM